MDTKAYAKFIHMSPRKVRLVADVVRGLRVDEALNRLRFANKKAGAPLLKLVLSATANAEHNFELEKDNLFIKEIRVDEAPTIRRWMPRAHGRATTIRKRNSHITLVLGEVKDSGKKAGKKSAIEAPVKLGKAVKEKSAVDATAPAAAKSQTQNDTTDKELSEEKGKEIVDPRMQGRRGHAPMEGGRKGFASKMFRRKSG